MDWYVDGLQRLFMDEGSCVLGRSKDVAVVVNHLYI